MYLDKKNYQSFKFLVFKTPLNMSEGERRTSLEVESK